MRLLLSALLLIVFSSVVQTGHGYPKATDRAERWQLRLDTNDLSYYRDKKTGEGYWVLVYEVTNETNKDRNWIPNFELTTDRGEIIPNLCDSKFRCLESRPRTYAWLRTSSRNSSIRKRC